MDLERTVHDLAERVAALEAALQAQATPSSQYAPPAPGAVLSQPPPPSPEQRLSGPALTATPGPPMVLGPPIGAALDPDGAAATPARTPSFEWGIESVLRWAGVGLVTLAGIFLVSTAVSRGWIGPELQLLGAALGGLALLAGAVHLAETRREWALALGCGGSIVIIASSLATHEWLDLVGPGPAVGLAAAATLVAIAVAVWTRVEGIALVATVVAMFGALDTLESFGDGALLGWVLGVAVVAIALGLAQRWAGLRLITGWLGAFLLMIYALAEDAEGDLQVAGFVCAALLASLLWLAPTIATRMGPIQKSGTWGTFDWTPIDYRLVALVPGWVWAVVSGLVMLDDQGNYGVIAVVTATAFMALTAATFGQVDRTVSLSTLLGAFSLLAVGFAVYFDGPALMVALAGQAATSYVLSRRLNDTSLLYAGALAGLAASLLALGEMAEAIEREGFDNVGHALATALVVSCWIWVAVFVRDRKDLGVPFEPVFVGAWAGSLMWLAAALIAAPQGLMLISAAWTAVACAGLVVGLTQRHAIVKNAALVTLALTLAKLVTVDLAEVDVFWRVGLFFVIGMGLIALGLKVPSLIAPTESEAVPSPAQSDDQFTTF